MTGQRPPAWWRDGETVQALARDLVVVDRLRDREDVLDFFEKPFKWSVEWLYWEEHQRSDSLLVWEGYDEWEQDQRVRR